MIDRRYSDRELLQAILEILQRVEVRLDDVHYRTDEIARAVDALDRRQRPFGDGWTPSLPCRRRRAKA